MYSQIYQLRWQDVIDILFVSYLLFRFYVIFKGTHVLRVLIAIALLFFLQRIAVLLGLVVTSWAIQGITAASALLIIVLFTREIRSVFQTRNLGLLLWGFHFKQKETPCDIVADVVFDFAKERTGALIIFPGKEDIRGVIQKSIKWDGKLSREMLHTIFEKNSPVHDGAVIVQGDRITDVSVILPLSTNPNLPNYFGTRHRAAVGLTEVTDALVVVVSEERGVVSISKGGEITPVSQKDVFVQILRKHLGLTEQEKEGLRKARLEFALVGLVSLGLITGTWISFTKGYDTVLAYNVPIEYTNRPPGLEIMETSASFVKVELVGAGPVIRFIKPDQISIRVDLSNAVSGKNTYTITKDNITLPPGVTLSKVTPQFLDVFLDEVVEKFLPVQVDWVGTISKELLVTKVDLDPSRVRVLGGKKVLEGIETVYTEKVQVEMINSDTIITSRLVLTPASLKLVPGQREKVNIEVKVISKEDWKEGVDTEEGG